MQRRQITTRGDSENSAEAEPSAGCRTVEVSVRCMEETRSGIYAVGALALCAEAVKGRQGSAQRNFEDGSEVRRSPGFRCSVEGAIRGLYHS